MRKTKAPSQLCKTENKKISQEILSISQATIRDTTHILNILDNAKKEFNILNGSISKISHSPESLVPLECISSEESNKKVYSVVWGKPSKKKHKTWEGDGILEVYKNSVVLKNEDGVVLGRASKPKSLEEGSRAYIGNKEIEIITILENENVFNINDRSLSKTTFNSLKNETEVCDFAESNFIEPDTKRFKKNSVPSFTLQHGIKSEQLVMPVPDYNHQWKFNEEQLPLMVVKLDSFLSRRLRPHQKQGVTFLYSCVTAIRNINYNGAILADEMGLGKTLQCICLVWLLLKSGPYGGIPLVKKVLIVTPSSLVNNWLKEFKQWIGFERLQPFVINKKIKPADYFKIPSTRQPVWILSYEMLVRYIEDIKNIQFDLLICDEGHRLKNNQIRTSMSLSQLGIKCRIILTGTPVQNDLQEFYALVDFVNPGILGSSRDFTKYFEEPIILSNKPDCEDEIRALGEERAKELNHRTNCFILRRTHSVIDKYLPLKQECVVFCSLTSVQIELMSAIISFWEHSLLNTDQKVPHLSIITILRKLCNDPRLLKLDTENFITTLNCFKNDEQTSKHLNLMLEKLSDIDETTIEFSSKLSVVSQFLSEIRKLNEKVVLISYFTQTLNLLENLCQQKNYTYLRLDGNTQTAVRQRLVDKFNSSNFDTFAFLLSAKAGGTGLNLVGASRLILFDLDWNPASDLQAMSRIWRDGQKKNVYIYRLLSSGTIEEKMYQRQISKTFLSNAVIDVSNSTDVRLSVEDLKDLFAFKPDCISSTHDLLHCECDGNGIPDSEFNDEKENISNEERDCQLKVGNETKITNKNISKISELMSWEHYFQPVPENILKELCLNSTDHISFILRNKSSENEDYLE